MPDQSRRDLLKTAVAVGGSVGLSACLDALGDQDRNAPPVPSGPADLSTLPTRQFAWGEYVRHDEWGNEQLPRHQTLLYLNLPGEGPPTSDQRGTVERAFTRLDEAYAWSHEALLRSVAYSPEYFQRYGSIPEGVDIYPAERLSPFETPDFDRQDALLHLASDRPDALLEAELALTGERASANGVDFDAALTDAFEVADRRTGFVGAGLPAEKQEGLEGVPEDGPVPEASPLFMGFKAGFAKNQAPEDRVAIQEGPFAEGTTKHVSNLRQRLSDWYGEQDFTQRVMEMFSPMHAENDWVEGVGENLEDDSRVDETLDTIREQARENGRVGHAQKAARANRDADGTVKLNRRHFESTDDNVASLHFPSLQRRMSEFDAVRQAMNGQDLTEVTPAVRQRVNNGILEYIFVRHRGNFLVPPRPIRALPTPDGDAPM
ncbi:MAG: Tat pathway signal protein [Haloglomus sp.]